MVPSTHGRRIASVLTIADAGSLISLPIPAARVSSAPITSRCGQNVRTEKGMLLPVPTDVGTAALPSAGNSPSCSTLTVSCVAESTAMMP
jgi:hypothetical protein